MLRPRCWSGKNRTRSPRPGLLAIQGPGQHGLGVGRGADRTPVAPHERLQGGGRVHVGDRDEAVDVDHPSQLVPGLLHLVDVRHVRHGATGIEIGQQHLLVVTRQHIGRLRHEVHPAEHDERGLGLPGGDPGEPEGVTPGVGPAHHLVPLVVVPQNEHTGSERGLGRTDHRGQLVRVCGRVALRKWRLKPEHLVCPLVGSASIWPAGTAWSPIRGYVGLDARLYAGNQAGTDHSNARHQRRRETAQK